jgi:hypothetical protein
MFPGHSFAMGAIKSKCCQPFAMFRDCGKALFICRWPSEKKIKTL